MITYSKLKDGTWALRGPSSDLCQGETVVVNKRGGETRRERVGRVLYAVEQLEVVEDALSELGKRHLITKRMVRAAVDYFIESEQWEKGVHS